MTNRHSFPAITDPNRLAELRAAFVRVVETDTEVFEISNTHRAIPERVWVDLATGEVGTGRRPNGGVTLQSHIVWLEREASKPAKSVKQAAKPARPQPVAKPALRVEREPALPRCIANAMRVILPLPLSKEQIEALAAHPEVVRRQEVLRTIEHGRVVAAARRGLDPSHGVKTNRTPEQLKAREEAKAAGLKHSGSGQQGKKKKAA